MLYNCIVTRLSTVQYGKCHLNSEIVVFIITELYLKNKFLFKLLLDLKDINMDKGKQHFNTKKKQE
jgi:hypothetical protein